MNILYHHRTRGEDAQGIHIREIVSAFRRLGHNVTVMGPVDLEPGDHHAPDVRRWFSTLTLGIPAWLYELLTLTYNFYGYARLARQIRRCRPDLIYERYSLNTFCGILARRRFNIPLLLEANAPFSIEQRALGRLSFGRLARFSDRWICSNASRTIVVSEVMKATFAGLGVPPQKLVVIPNAIDPEIFRSDISGEPVRTRYGLHGRVVIGFIGWLRPWHGLEMLLEACYEAQLPERGARVMLIGDGPALPELRAYTRTHRLEDCIVFTGPVSRADVPAHIAALDIAVQPSATQYASPMKLFEYMAMAKCIVAPDQPNVREILVSGETACLFTPGDKTSLAARLLDLVGAPEERERLGHHARHELLQRRYLWSENARRALGLIPSTASPEARTQPSIMAS
jgi:glycosyltransferase involved in cell wall biosynthesis